MEKLPADAATPVIATAPLVHGDAMLAITTSLLAAHLEFVTVSVSELPEAKLDVELFFFLHHASSQHTHIHSTQRGESIIIYY
jgi:hypothetical protein